MVDADVVTRRLLSLNEALDQLVSADATDGDKLRGEPMRRAAVERWLQVAIEATIDLAYHVIADRGWTPPETARDAFLVLADHGLLEHALARRLGGAASMRNVLVHEYAAVDVDKVARAVRDDLGDLRAFGAAVATLIDET